MPENGETRKHRRVTLAELRQHRNEINRLAHRYGVRNIRVFGPILEDQPGEETQRYDLQFLVDLEPNRSLFDTTSFALDIEDQFGFRVEVVTASALREELRDDTIDSAVPL